MSPVRVLHVVHRMQCGGTETWLMHVLRALDPARVRMDFLVHSTEEGHYDAEIRALGSRVTPCLSPSAPGTYARQFVRMVREHGRYDVVHSHVHHFSGVVLALARIAGVPIRIAHSHTSALDPAASPARRAYIKAMRAALNGCATRGLAASGPAAASLFGPRWSSDARWRVLHCALDFSPYRESVESAIVRAELGVSPSALVVGHVGRFDPHKNHAFLLRIAAEACRRDSRVVFVLVGDGVLRPEIEKKAAQLGLAERVVFTGVRADVHRIMRAFDVLLFPSLYEGLGLVVLEAQAGAVPVVLSDTVPREVAVVPELFRWHGLAEPAETWAAAVLEAPAARSRLRGDPVARLEASSFSIGRSVRLLMDEYGAGV